MNGTLLGKSKISTHRNVPGRGIGAACGDITEALWGSKVSPATISELNKKAYVHIEAWRSRRAVSLCLYWSAPCGRHPVGNKKYMNIKHLEVAFDDTSIAD